MRKSILLLFGMLACAQLTVPLYMIRNNERILRDGKVYRFKTQPIDPADPFQGRYVWLSFDANSVECSPEQMAGLAYRQTIYVSIGENDEGFAEFTGWALEPPFDGNFLETRYTYPDRTWIMETKNYETNGIHVDLPFNRFYMDEAKAPRAERLVRAATRTTNCWANVRILDGSAALEDVYVEGKSLRELAGKKE